jgi:spore coat polysaccharide biosynthesis protein SpsF
MEHVGHFGADNPLIDPALCDAVIGIYLEGGWDYVTNNLPPTVPDGEEVEVTSYAALDTAAREASDPRHREHLLTFLWEHPDRFRIRNVTREPSLHHERWTVDTPEDWELVRAVFDALDPGFTIADVIAFLDEHPQLRTAPGSYDWRR